MALPLGHGQLKLYGGRAERGGNHRHDVHGHARSLSTERGWDYTPISYAITFYGVTFEVGSSIAAAYLAWMPSQAP